MAARGGGTILSGKGAGRERERDAAERRASEERARVNSERVLLIVRTKNSLATPLASLSLASPSSTRRMRLSAAAACSLARTSALFRSSRPSFCSSSSSSATTAAAKLPTNRRPQRMASASANANANAAAAASVAAAANAVGPPKADALRDWDEHEQVPFGPHPIPRSTVFATSALSWAFVNLRPVVPGHVLVSSKRIAPRFADLSAEEVSDLWLLAQKVGKVVEKQQQQQARKKEGRQTSSSSPSSSPSSALTFALQDGPSAGQSVPHVHVHVIPRGGPGDRFVGEEKNDELYPELQRAGAALASELSARESEASAPAPDPFQRERKDRTLQEMELEAAALRELFSKS